MRLPNTLHNSFVHLNSYQDVYYSVCDNPRPTGICLPSSNPFFC